MVAPLSSFQFAPSSIYDLQEKWLALHWKVDKKLGNLGEVKIERSGASISVTTSKNAKRYVKYLTKKVSYLGMFSFLVVALIVCSLTSITSTPRHFFSRHFFVSQYLKANSLRDYLRVLTSGKSTYELRYYKIASSEEADEE